MKKYFIFSITILALMGCQNKLPLDRYNYFPKEVNLADYNNLEFVKLRHGSTITVNISENPSTGYTWQTETQKVCSVTISKGNFEQDQSEGLVGVGGTKTFEVTAKKSGSCLIEFTHVGPGTDAEVAERKGIYFIVE